jgi:methylated-DNA-[protein]-cysteine S-methyltransferase
MTTISSTLDSPIGPLTLIATDGVLTGLSMAGQRHERLPSPGTVRDDAGFADIRDQLDRYFEGELIDFDIPMDMQGTDFQRSVWASLCEIPYGDTISYKELAQWVGNPNAFRAVGLANGRNPIALIVPCHRVIAANGQLGGYGGGLDRKTWLLEHEAKHRPN